MTYQKSPYKEKGIHPANILGWSDKAKKDPRKTKDMPIEQQIMKILKGYVWDNYNRQRYYDNVCKAVVKLFEERRTDEKI